MKRVLVCLSSVFVLLVAGCQHQANQTNHASQPISNETIRLQTDNVYEKLVDIRRDIHTHPELAGNEIRTSAKIAAHLREIGLEVQTGLYGHSVVGILRGAQSGKTIAWRADLDALPGFYPDPEEFRSKNHNVHHACGHDIHIAIALGMAEVLAKNRANLRGTAVFIFQPEEETFKGAKALVERGVFSSIKPDEIYGLHITGVSVGQIFVRPNELFAYQRRVRLTLKDELSAQEIEQLTKRVQSELSRTRPGAKPWELPRILDPEVGLANPNTAFQDYLIMDPAFDVRRENGELFLEAYLYETNASNLPGIVPRIERTIEASGHKSKLRSVSYVQANPTVINDEKLTQQAVRTLQQAVGADAIRPMHGQVPFFNDDFAYFQRKVPGVYFFLGGSNFEKGMIAMNHAPNFQADEESIRFGVRSFSSLMLARLGVSVAPLAPLAPLAPSASK
jgi:metal-dependent amidase/aminoacylase/carboxypeptidase family protein